MNKNMLLAPDLDVQDVMENTPRRVRKIEDIREDVDRLRPGFNTLWEAKGIQEVAQVVKLDGRNTRKGNEIGLTIRDFGHAYLIGLFELDNNDPSKVIGYGVLNNYDGEELIAGTGDVLRDFEGLISDKLLQEDLATKAIVREVDCEAIWVDGEERKSGLGILINDVRILIAQRLGVKRLRYDACSPGAQRLIKGLGYPIAAYGSTRFDGFQGYDSQEDFAMNFLLDMNEINELLSQ